MLRQVTCRHWLMIGAVGVGVVMGCRQETTNGPASSGPATSDSAKSTDSARPDTGTPNSATPIDSRPAEVLTTTTRLAADDPVADGWETEQFSLQAGDQLKKLGALLTLGRRITAQDVQAKIVPTFTCPSLRPESTQTAFRNEIADVLRWNAADAAGRDGHSGAAGLATALNQVAARTDGSRDARFKFKVFRVQSAAGSMETDTYFQLSGQRGKQRVQVNSTWRCTWTVGSGVPRLNRIDVLDYEEVELDAADGPWFADCTESVLQGTVYREQLQYGIDHWLTSIETRHGIDVGGWQGVAVGDVNGDGLEDLYVCQPGGLPNRLFLQQPDGTCRENSAAAGVDWIESCHGALLVDFDNDGDQDLAIGLPDGLMFMSNDGDGVFQRQLTRILPSGFPYSLSAADYDNDGDLDLYVCCYNSRQTVNRHVLFARPVPYHDANNGSRNVLLRNDIRSPSQRWQFSYVTKQVGLDENNTRFSYAAAWEDYDNDGDLDLYVANDFGRNNLYQNDGGRFRDVARAAGVEDVSPGMSACWGDYDNDGAMDLYVSNMFSSAGNRITFQSRFLQDADSATRGEFQRHARGNSLFRNQGDGTFADVSQESAVTLGRWAWGSKFVDLNNDGWQDLVVTNGFITQPDTGDL